MASESRRQRRQACIEAPRRYRGATADAAEVTDKPPHARMMHRRSSGPQVATSSGPERSHEKRAPGDNGCSIAWSGRRATTIDFGRRDHSSSGTKTGIRRWRWRLRPARSLTLDILISVGSDLDESNNVGETALMLAAARGHADMSISYCRRVPALPPRADDGTTALIMAVRDCHEKTVRSLVNGKADTNATLPDGQTALMLAATACSEQIVRLLLTTDTHIDATDKKGPTALWFAADRGNAAIVEALIDKGQTNALQIGIRDAIPEGAPERASHRRPTIVG